MREIAVLVFEGGLISSLREYLLGIRADRLGPRTSPGRPRLVAGLLGGPHDRVQLVLVHVDERDARALGRQAQRARPAAPAGSEDQGSAAGRA
jgi:hypothetical protein